jgi:hypothetical protein
MATKNFCDICKKEKKKLIRVGGCMNIVIVVGKTKIIVPKSTKSKETFKDTVLHVSFEG